ncbi:rod shape-determining protein RodA [Spirulina subsalsa FACHB-351]|uniref:Peptidoglycan glycosyltransferase RodA n=1 Tax=Spirulina subsalsa FACHB-351 TaxID=234711 RepID=A0ABT3L4L0_9CYAN|nr:rod shape-determining protein RodA [Spirulina subsalsa]MCW6036451.1 rod shape-determining protein RodA [Spirulina subsalsa FACHB-351]
MLNKTQNKFLHWKLLLRGWQQIDWILMTLVVILTFLGGVSIRSAALTSTRGTDWWQHWLVGLIGVVIAFAIARWQYKAFLHWHWLIYAISNITLIIVILIGVEANGAQRSINILNFNIIPSEFAKVSLIITQAAILQNRSNPKVTLLLQALGVTIIPWALVVLQPDLGTSLVFGVITLSMLYWANVNPGWLILMGSPMIAALLYNLYLPSWFVWVGLMSLLAWFTIPWRVVGTFFAVLTNVTAGGIGGFMWGLLKDYQKDRLTLFLQPEKDPLGGGYHLIQSRIAIGSGSMWGRGLHQGTQTQLNFIPEQHTDFIFSVIGEELGFVGSALVLIAFWWLCLRLILIAQNSKEDFGSLLAIGVLSMIAFQVLINVGMTIGLAPVTGLPLPFLSYGRSALLANFIALGLVEAVSNHQPRWHFRD